MYAPVVSRFETYGVEVPQPVRAYMDRVLALPAMQEWRAVCEKEIEAGLPHQHNVMAHRGVGQPVGACFTLAVQSASPGWRAVARALRKVMVVIQFGRG